MIFHKHDDDLYVIAHIRKIGKLSFNDNIYIVTMSDGSCVVFCFKNYEEAKKDRDDLIFKINNFYGRS